MSETRGYSYGDFVLDPQKMSFSRSERGSLILTLDDEEHTDLKIRRAFPLEESNRYIGVFAAEDQELGIIEDPQQLDDQSRQVLLDELDKIYFQPQVLAFDSLDEIGINLSTARPDRNHQRPAPTRNPQLRTNVRMLSGGRAIIEDVDGNRYLIANWRGAAAKNARDSGALIDRNGIALALPDRWCFERALARLSIIALALLALKIFRWRASRFCANGPNRRPRWCLFFLVHPRLCPAKSGRGKSPALPNHPPHPNHPKPDPQPPWPNKPRMAH